MRETKKDDITEVLKIISPGTPIREGLENILKAKTGMFQNILRNSGIKKAIPFSLISMKLRTVTC